MNFEKIVIFKNYRRLSLIKIPTHFQVNEKRERLERATSILAEQGLKIHGITRLQGKKVITIIVSELLNDQQRDAIWQAHLQTGILIYVQTRERHTLIIEEN